MFKITCWLSAGANATLAAVLLLANFLGGDIPWSDIVLHLSFALLMAAWALERQWP